MVSWSAGGADLPFSPPHGHLGTSGHHTLANLSIFPRACLNTDFWALPSVSDSVPLGWSLECAFYLFFKGNQRGVFNYRRYFPASLFFFFKDVFISFWLCGVLVAALRERGGYSSLVVPRLLTKVTSLAAEHGLWVHRLQQLWREGLVAPASGIFPDQGWNPCPLH